MPKRMKQPWHLVGNQWQRQEDYYTVYGPHVPVKGKPKWWIAPIGSGFHGGCLNCPPHPPQLPMNAVLAVGFGMVTVTKDDEFVWGGDDERRWIRRYENAAANDPDHDWRVEFSSPMSEATYQRHGPKEWVLIRKGPGFA